MNSRLTKLRELLTKEDLDALFISSLSNITYLTNFSDFTNVDRDGFILVTKKNQYIFTHGIYKEAVKKGVPHFTLIDITRENPISAALKRIIKQEKIKKMGFESFDLYVNEYERLLQEINKSNLVASNIIHQLRIIKTDNEIQLIKQACDLGDKAFQFIVKKIKPGITESALAVELEFFVKSNGATLSFDSVIAFGPNASKPHHVPTNTTLQKNQFILLDFGVKYNNYCSDMTRTIFLGEANKKQKKVYETVLTAQKKAIQQLHSGIKAQKLDEIARDFIISQGFPSIPHSLGHGIGLEVHESPRLTPLSHDTLIEGMVFSIEPGIYLPGQYGIRIEDLFAIKDDKLIQLTKSKKGLIELPALP